MATQIVGIVMCAVGVLAATIWFATDVGVPSETAVPVMVVALLALRSLRRHSEMH